MVMPALYAKYFTPIKYISQYVFRRRVSTLMHHDEILFYHVFLNFYVIQYIPSNK